MAFKIKYNPDLDSLTSKELKLLEKACEAVRNFVSKSDKINQTNYKTRDAHVTTYSTLKGTFVANQTFEEHHIFSRQELECLIRISNAHMKLVSKKRAIPAYGFSVKISDDNQTIANFPLVNFPLFPINNVSQFLKIFIAINRFFSGNILQKFWNLIKVARNFILISPAFFHRSFMVEVFKFLKNRNNFILSFDYHSIGVYRLRNHLVKLKLVPKNVPNKVDENRIDYSIQNYLKENDYELELMAQYCYDLKKQPVNQLNTIWRNSEFASIGTIRITELIDKNNQWVENLSFNPFENIEELQPVGRIQKLRDEAYKTSFATRKNNNL